MTEKKQQQPMKSRLRVGDPVVAKTHRNQKPLGIIRKARVSGNFDVVVSEGSVDWISVRDAVDLLSSKLGDPAAKDTIISRLEDGLPEGAAEAVVQEADEGNFYFDEMSWGRYHPQTRRSQRDEPFFDKPALNGNLVQVSARFMAKGEKWSIDLDRTDWNEGCFLARRQARFEMQNIALAGPDTLIRRAVCGLHFRRANIEELAGPDALAKKRTGRPRKDMERVTFWHEIISLALAGQLTKDSFLTFEELLHYMEGRKTGIETTTIEPLVSQTYNKFIRQNQ